MSNDYVMVSRKHLAELNQSLSFGDAPTHLLDWLDVVVTHTEPAPAQDEREAVEVEAWLLEWKAGNRGGIDARLSKTSLDGLRKSLGASAEIVCDEPLMTVAQHERIVAALTRRAQTEQAATVKECLTVQPVAYAVFAANGNVACFSTQRDHPSDWDRVIDAAMAAKEGV